MAQIVPTFDLMSICSGNINSEVWVDITACAPDINSPIPSGIQLMMGYAICIANDKALKFEIRPNLPTKSAGTLADTQLRGYASISAAGESKEIDLTYGGDILSLAPVSAPSTGVEKLWLRITSGTNSSATWEFMMFYSKY